MFSFFRAKKRDLNQLLFDVAEHKRRRDYDELYRRLRETKLFLPIVSSSVPLESGQKITTTSATQLVTRTAQFPNGMIFMLSFIDSADPRLQPHFGELTAKEAMTMALKSSVTGLLIHNRQESWVALPRDAIQTTLDKYFA